MEIDALLILALSVLAWRHDKAGAWVVALRPAAIRVRRGRRGWRPGCAAPLPPSRRRQTICVIQIAALTLVMLPAIEPPLSTVLAAAALVALTWSFLIDTVWLWRHAGVRRRGLAAAAAIALLNASLAFQNVWPTPAIRWAGEFSVECAVSC